VTNETISTARIVRLLERTRYQHEKIAMNLKIRRSLINQATADFSEGNQLGTLLPAPFQKTSLAIRSMIGAPAKAAQHYASRIASNRPEISVVPITSKPSISDTVDKMAGAQERLDSQLWVESGGRDCQWQMGWAMSVGGAGYYLTLPRDANFGLPDRIMYGDKTQDEIDAMIKDGKVSSVPVDVGGKMIYAEHGDVWAARRKNSMQVNFEAGRSLFTLQAYPRDMVLREKDNDGIKWAAIVEEIPYEYCAPGSDLAISAAKYKGISSEDIDRYGLFVDKKTGKIVGGIPKGGPLNTDWESSDVYTLIRFFTRTEEVILISGQGSVDTAEEIWRGNHGCTIMGAPTCPVVEVPFFQTDVSIEGQEFSTPLSQVFGIVPQINQLLTLASNAAAFNGIPRWVVELTDGSTLRTEDGEPKMVESGEVPGLDPNEAAAYPGTLKQLTIDTKSIETMLGIYLEQLEKMMPAPVTSGAAGASAAAWQVRELIQQAQETLRQPVDNHAQAVKQIVQMWHDWLRDLDVPIYFFAAPGKRKTRLYFRSLIEFDPKDLTDSIVVAQELDTPGERTIRVQQGMELLKSGLINYQTFFEEYDKTEDARQAVIDMYVQQVVSYVMSGIMPLGASPNPDPSGVQPIIKVVADSVRGAVNYALLEQSPNYAIATAEAMAQQAQQQVQQMGPAGPLPPNQPLGMTPMPSPGLPTQRPSEAGQAAQFGQGDGNVAFSSGVVQPGMGMSPDLSQQLGSRMGAPLA
jgi:hypothetical protein